MLHTRFKPLSELRQLIAARAAWPTVLLQVSTPGAYRPDVPGPLSIFANAQGESVVRTDGFAGRVPPGTFALSNAGATYTLEVEHAAETQNLHVGQGVMEEVYSALTTPDDRLLDGPATPGSVAFVPRLHRRDAAFERHYARAFRVGAEAPEALDEAVAGLLRHLLAVHRDGLAEMARVPAARASTRAELYRRIARSLDLAHAEFARPLSLDALARAACLSKYHYLRVFRQALGQTPHQYLTGLRVDAARRLLRTDLLAVAEVGQAVGYDDPSVFSRTFRRHVGVAPGRFRAAV